MKIETLIAKIQTDKNPGGGSIPKDIMDAVTGLVSRLEGMLPSVETAREVATKLGVDWGKEPNDPVLAWAWTVWPLHSAGRIGELLPVVLPLLPAGQPFGQSEFDAVHGETLIAEVEGKPEAAAAARGKGRAMLDHNRKGGFTRRAGPSDPGPAKFD